MTSPTLAVLRAFNTALVHFSSSLSYMTSAASETKSLTATQRIVSHVSPGRNYRTSRGKGVKRKQLRRARKSVASRYYQLMSGQAAIGPYLKEKIRKTDDDRCWWCGGGKKQTRHRLFTECRAWLPQIRRLWKDIGKACGWKHPRAPSVKLRWKEKATEAVSRDTRVRCISTRRKPPEEECDGE